MVFCNGSVFKRPAVQTTTWPSFRILISKLTCYLQHRLLLIIALVLFTKPHLGDYFEYNLIVEFGNWRPPSHTALSSYYRLKDRHIYRSSQVCNTHQKSKWEAEGWGAGSNLECDLMYQNCYVLDQRHRGLAWARGLGPGSGPRVLSLFFVIWTLCHYFFYSTDR